MSSSRFNIFSGKRFRAAKTDPEPLQISNPIPPSEPYHGLRNVFPTPPSQRQPPSGPLSTRPLLSNDAPSRLPPENSPTPPSGLLGTRPLLSYNAPSRLQPDQRSPMVRGSTRRPPPRDPPPPPTSAQLQAGQPPPLPPGTDGPLPGPQLMAEPTGGSNNPLNPTARPSQAGGDPAYSNLPPQAGEPSAGSLRASEQSAYDPKDTDPIVSNQTPANRFSDPFDLDDPKVLAPPRPELFNRPYSDPFET